MEISFNEWFDLFSGQLRGLGWLGPIDREAAEEDFDNGLSPEEAAKTLYDDLVIF